MFCNHIVCVAVLLHMVIVFANPANKIKFQFIIVFLTN